MISNLLYSAYSTTVEEPINEQINEDFQEMKSTIENLDIEALNEIKNEFEGVEFSELLTESEASMQYTLISTTTTLTESVFTNTNDIITLQNKTQEISYDEEIERMKINELIVPTNEQINGYFKPPQKSFVYVNYANSVNLTSYTYFRDYDDSIIYSIMNYPYGDGTTKTYFSGRGETDHKHIFRGRTVIGNTIDTTTESLEV